MTAQPSITKAALWMSVWLALMLIMTVAGREATRELEVFQIMEMRAVIGIFMLLPLVYLAGGLQTVRTRVFRLHVGRNIVHYGAQFAWFVALTMIPLAQLISIEFTMPIWTAILAAFFLGEKIGPWKLLSILLGVIGVAIIVRPGVGDINEGQLIALAAAVGFAISVTMVKALTRHDSVLTIIFWMLIIQSALGLLPALMVWRWPSAEIWPWVLVIAFCGVFSHYSQARAMTYADATIVIPMDFLRVPLSALLGWLYYQEALDIWTVAGAVLILFGNMLNLRNAGTARIPPAEKDRPQS
jgi:drug/metabolite transporter (DMT)-like permease